jgi:formylglycine-generating enzyme required for sulfatase activity
MKDSLTSHPLDQGHAPPWASEWGEDVFGVFAGFDLDGISHRFRWIPPGSFLMGSPEGEQGRLDQEGPQHEVTLTRGFWLGEVPCTQELWQAVTGDNPSEFPFPERPVEQISWDQCKEFLEALNRRLPGLEARLPTEAEWEYACRGGTMTSTYAGELEILGANDAPLLDEIAWYGGNSGHELDLEKGWDSSGWSEKQYPHVKSGTRIVGLKRPNRWGLYDMLGNVWEWCSDWYGPYAPEPASDPRGPSEGSKRVVRGGSWFDVARSVRCASRGAHDPGGRYEDLGFRLARGQGE